MNVSGAPPTTSHSQYRHPNIAGDLAYYPAPGKNNSTSKSFSDTGFGMQTQPANVAFLIILPERQLLGEEIQSPPCRP